MTLPEPATVCRNQNSLFLSRRENYEKTFVTIDDIQYLIDVIERARTYREENTYLNVSFALPRSSGHQHSDGLVGNLGAILFRSSNGTTLGGNWIAASSKLRKTIRSQAFSRGDVAVSYNGLGKVAMWSTQKHSTIMSAPLVATNPKHKNDSEHVLLNALHSRLRTCGLDAGSVLLLTERLPCASCTDVIIEFVKRNPAVKLSVAYISDYVNKQLSRSHVDFHQQLLQSKVFDVPLVKVDQASRDDWEFSMIPSSAVLHGCRSENFGPGTFLWAGKNPDGTDKKIPWRNEDYLRLRQLLRIPTSD
jgi:hypothetical protein